MCLIDVNECENGTNDCDPKLATCENTVGSYTCHCEPGFTGDGKYCSGKAIFLVHCSHRIKMWSKL